MTGGSPGSSRPLGLHPAALRLRVLALAAVLTGLMSSVPARAQRLESRDVFLTLKARQALRQDDEVAALRLTVHVQRGVATVWGPVTSPEQAERARRLVEAVAGVYEVRDDCYTALTPLPSPAPEIPLPRQPVVAQARPMETGEEPWDGIHVVTRHKVEMLPDPDNEPLAPRETPKPAIALLAPITIPVPKTPIRDDLWIRAERLCNSDPAYRDIRFEVSEGVVTLKGRVARDEQRTALAQALSRLPGVDRVSIREVEVGGR